MYQIGYNSELNAMPVKVGVKIWGWGQRPQLMEANGGLGAESPALQNFAAFFQEIHIFKQILV